ncbi:MAG TPA: NAD(P)/FAD-dependent oxidoreductase [Flavipsychrobacter sp.]|nr:NAD(P)/FAD-dependent oxidoreductase [Flavipsychrobacter sp.]
MSVQRIETSVVIVGAGPAGAATSIFLSQKGIQHVIIEKETFPRDKVCGDACSGKTAFVLRKANPQWLDEILGDTQRFTPSYGITFYAPNGKPLDIPFTPKRTPETKAPGFTVPRLTFDNFLFEKIPSPYATVLQQVKINEITTKENKVYTSIKQNGKEYEIISPLIVGADGDKSQVRKTFINDNSSPKAYAIGLRAYYEGITDLHYDNFIELHFLPEVLPGYFWIFPLPNGMANVGVGILSETVRKKKINLREQMLNAIKTNSNISHRFANAKLIDKIQGWGLPLAMERQPLSGNNFILTGDAASLVDPFSGEGISNALYSGMLATDAIKQSLEIGTYDAAFLKEKYDDVLYKKLGDEFKISAAMQRMTKYRWLFNLVVNKAYKSVSLKNTISCMFTDMDLRDQLRRPSFYFKVLINR